MNIRTQLKYKNTDEIHSEEVLHAPHIDRNTTIRLGRCSKVKLAVRHLRKNTQHTWLHMNIY